MGSLFCGLRATRRCAMLLFMVRKLCVQWVPICAPLWRAATSIDRELPEAAPYDFLRSAPAPRGPTECSEGSTSAPAAAARVSRRKGRIADAKVA